MLGFCGGRRTDQYELSARCLDPNTQWITGHFHLIFGGAIVINVFSRSPTICGPHLTGRALGDLA